MYTYFLDTDFSVKAAEQQTDDCQPQRSCGAMHCGSGRTVPHMVLPRLANYPHWRLSPSGEESVSKITAQTQAAHIVCYKTV